MSLHWLTRLAEQLDRTAKRPTKTEDKNTKGRAFECEHESPPFSSDL